MWFDLNDCKTFTTTTAADGRSTRTIRNFTASGVMINATQIVTAANSATSTARSVTTGLDQNGDGLFDETQAYTRDAAGISQTLTTKLAANGKGLARQLVTASADGSTKTKSYNQIYFARYHIPENENIKFIMVLNSISLVS